MHNAYNTSWILLNTSLLDNIVLYTFTYIHRYLLSELYGSASAGDGYYILCNNIIQDTEYPTKLGGTSACRYCRTVILFILFMFNIYALRIKIEISWNILLLHVIILWTQKYIYTRRKGRTVRLIWMDKLSRRIHIHDFGIQLENPLQWCP